MYNVPNTNYTVKTIPLSQTWIKAAWMRSGTSPHSTFAMEQVVDELAHAAGMDPVAFRRQNVTESANEGTVACGARHGDEGCQLAAELVVAETVERRRRERPRHRVVERRRHDEAGCGGRGHQVNKKTGKITVKHIYQAFSAGLLINPGMVENQMVGGITQILSRVLVEEMRYSKTNVMSTDFVSYPILRFKDAPLITAMAVQWTDIPPQGVGEPVTIVAPAAVANAFYDATGVRLRTAPLTPARVRAALKAAGVA